MSGSTNKKGPDPGNPAATFVTCLPPVLPVLHETVVRVHTEAARDGARRPALIHGQVGQGGGRGEVDGRVLHPVPVHLVPHLHPGRGGEKKPVSQTLKSVFDEIR